MRKWYLVSSVFQIVVGVAAVITYIVIAAAGEPLGKWTVTLALAILFIALGIVGIVEYRNANREREKEQ